MVADRPGDTPLDPRTMTPDDWRRVGYREDDKLPLGPSVRRYCVEVCMGGSPKETLLCENAGCPLWPFRMGSNPWRKPPSQAQVESARRMTRQRTERPSVSSA